MDQAEIYDVSKYDLLLESFRHPARIESTVAVVKIMPVLHTNSNTQSASLQ